MSDTKSSISPDGRGTGMLAVSTSLERNLALKVKYL